MMRWLEFALFTAIAVALHVAFFVVKPNEGAEAGGVGGEEIISLQAAAPTVIEMVEAWERPTQVETEQDAVLDPPTDPVTARPPLPSLQVQPAPRAEMRMAIMDPAPTRDSLDIDTAPADPPPAPELDPETVETPAPDAVPDAAPTTRPKLRPERQPDPQTAKTSDAQSAGRAERRAAGSGGTAQAGNTGAAEVATASPGQQQQLQAVWGAKIRAKLARQQRYPRGTRQNGRTQIILNVARSGQILGVSVGRSSGVSALDQAALDAVKRARRFAKAPDDLPGSSFKFSLVLDWRR
ncbi:TonB family protein [uncultured Roseobacter sp.]|uniref:TonB family protein n=1 Tax=uncultured Roseobacter sp. TaxID=114847 RepID=UPI0026360496|nr:TonB family protein [uncultured Roseobacter sp.]